MHMANSTARQSRVGSLVLFEHEGALDEQTTQLKLTLSDS